MTKEEFYEKVKYFVKQNNFTVFTSEGVVGFYVTYKGVVSPHSPSILLLSEAYITNKSPMEVLEALEGATKHFEMSLDRTFKSEYAECVKIVSSHQKMQDMLLDSVNIFVGKTIKVSGNVQIGSQFIVS